MKRLFLYLFMFNIILLSNVISLQAMKRASEPEENQTIKKFNREWEYSDWKYGTSFLDSCTFGRNRPRYAYFLSERGQDQSKHSFCDVLLFGKKMNDAGIPCDVTNAILRSHYAETIVSNEPLIEKSKKIFDINTFDVLYLKKEQKQALWYILNVQKNTITIEAPEEFSQRMSQNILGLPLPIRKKIVQKYGETMKATVHYKLLCGAICLDDEENKWKCVCCAAKLACLSSLLSFSCLTNFWIFLKEDYPYSLGGFPTLALILGHIYKDNSRLLHQMLTYNYNLHLLNETAEEKERRLGLVEIPLLQMECKIVDFESHSL